MKERRKKRIFCLVLSAGMMLLLTACSPGSEMSQGTTEMDSSVSAQTDEAHGNSSLDTLDSDSSNAVSYTHLDVYKRQLLKFARSVELKIHLNGMFKKKA